MGFARGLFGKLIAFVRLGGLFFPDPNEPEQVVAALARVWVNRELASRRLTMTFTR